MNNGTNNNKVYINGEIVSEKAFSHELFGEKFYEFLVKVYSLSGVVDILPVTISERLLDKDLKINDPIYIVGQFRSFNKIEGEKSRLKLTIFVKELLIEPNKNANSIILMGHLCKAPIYRTTPFNREICDMLVAVNREYNKSDYIPLIAWGRNARFASTLHIGDQIAIAGRIQSREYQKKYSEENIVTMTAYEVSVSKLAITNGDSDFDIEAAFGEQNDV